GTALIRVLSFDLLSLTEATSNAWPDEGDCPIVGGTAIASSITAAIPVTGRRLQSFVHTIRLHLPGAVVDGILVGGAGHGHAPLLRHADPRLHYACRRDLAVAHRLEAFQHWADICTFHVLRLEEAFHHL